MGFRDCVRGGIVIGALLLSLGAGADVAGPLSPPAATISAYVFLCVLLCGLPALGVAGLLFLRWIVRRVFGKGRPCERHRGCAVSLTIFLCYLAVAFLLLVWRFCRDYEQAKEEEAEWRRERNERRIERRMRRFEQANAPVAVPAGTMTNSPSAGK